LNPPIRKIRQITCAFPCALLTLICLFHVMLPGASYAQTKSCDDNTWKVLVGFIDSFPGAGESMMATPQSVRIRLRGGTRELPQQWAHDEWGKPGMTMADAKMAKVFNLQTRPDADQKVDLFLTGQTKIYRANAKGELSLNTGPIEAETPVLVVLAEGQCWPASETKTPSWASKAAAARVVLLQACIEESCARPKCKGKSGCKEKVCNCEH